MVSAEMLNCKLLSTQAADIKHLYFVAECLQHKYKRMIKSKFRAEYINIYTILCQGK